MLSLLFAFFKEIYSWYTEISGRNELGIRIQELI